MMPWDTRPYARSGGERNPSTATVSVTRQKQTHRSYPEHHPYSTATITSATARQTQETEKKFINAYSRNCYELRFIATIYRHPVYDETFEI